MEEVYILYMNIQLFQYPLLKSLYLSHHSTLHVSEKKKKIIYIYVCVYSELSFLFH